MNVEVPDRPRLPLARMWRERTLPQARHSSRELPAGRDSPPLGHAPAPSGRHAGHRHVDLAARAPDPALMLDHDPAACLAVGAMPWRRVGSTLVYAVTDPDIPADVLVRLHRTRGPVARVVVTRPALEAAVATVSAATLARRAAVRTPEGLSVRAIGRLRRRALAVTVVAAGLVALGGTQGVGAALLLLFVLNAATTVLRLAALVGGRSDRRRAETPDALAQTGDSAPPKISLLVPLYREANMIPGLVAGLEALDYPRDRIDVRLLLEADDTATRAAVGDADLPLWIRPLVVPAGGPRTKPRALNYALDFCTGDIVGILDAEDRPDHDQLGAVARHLREAPPAVACVQCPLTYFNARENWISRCFQMEYGIWFEVLLRGFQALRLPIPLGGTSVYFRRRVLEAVGAWDAHNVTEDADLGMRLARAGYRCDVLAPVTHEEANCRIMPWIRQRSRWLKGYLLTWLSHMRAPGRLWRDLGPRGFLGFNLLFLGAAAAYLAMPLFWCTLAVWVLGAGGDWRSVLPGWALWPVMLSLGIGQVVMLACAALAMRRRGALDLLIWVPVLPFYWTLGAIAAWKAVLELFVAPFYWDKTEHGISAPPAADRTEDAGPRV